MNIENRARIAVPILYVVKTLTNEPIKAINFILKNKEYFPELTPELLLKIMNEKNITQEDLDQSIEILRER